MDKIVLCTRSQLISIYGISEYKLRQIEYVILRQQRLKEIKHNSDELMDFLGFNDVEDFMTVGEDIFFEYSKLEGPDAANKFSKVCN